MWKSWEKVVWKSLEINEREIHGHVKILSIKCGKNINMSVFGAMQKPNKNANKK